jgi:hypothetical protein
MEPHDVIDSKQAGAFELMSETSDEVAMTLLAATLRVHRRETPILTAREDRIRWRTDRNVTHEQVPFPPNIETLGVGSERQVQIQSGSCSTGFVR